MYYLIKHPITNKIVTVKKQIDENTVMSFTFDPFNTDYQKFKKEVLNNTKLQDVDGNIMTQEQAEDFIKELP